jgi:hypothetical protein
MECEFPTVNANPEAYRELFASLRSIAILGCSPNPEKDSHQVAAYLKDAGYQIFPVYPSEDTILGEPVYRSLAAIPFPVDMVNVFRKPEALPAIVEATLQRPEVKVLWTQLGIVHNESAARAEEAGLQVVQSRCVMVEHRALHS